MPIFWMTPSKHTSLALALSSLQDDEDDEAHDGPPHALLRFG
jgi:hypothetical protein